MNKPTAEELKEKVADAEKALILAVKGFTKIFGNQTAIYYQVNQLQKTLIEQEHD